jgi:hypothetical protein
VGMAVFITQNGIALYNFKTKQTYILILNEQVKQIYAIEDVLVTASSEIRF